MIESTKILNKYFGHENFREGQQEIIEDIRNGSSVLGVLPTGSGKSICYQIPAMMLHGNVIVISPLLSLMEDQVKQLKAKGIKNVVAINSFTNSNEKNDIISNLSNYKLIYVSPEMIQNKQLLARLKQLHISLFVIDEAHCISQWGHEFRPDYLKLVEVVEQLNNPPLLALTATATPDVQKDILKYLNAPNMKKHIYPMDRENLTFAVQTFEHRNEKVAYIKTLLNKFDVPTMIYFSSKKEAETVAEQLNGNSPNLRIAFYHGGMDAVDRTLIQQQFMQNQLDVICCTSAFGMGIDKSNVRLIIHYHFPTQLESFIQEVGRAGRDGESSVSVVLYAPYDEMLPRRLIESELPSMEQVNSLLFLLDKKSQYNQFKLNKQEIMLQLEMNEVQWRFIVHHLEKHDILNKNQIMPIYDKKDRFLSSIEEVINERFAYKLNKLNEIVSWIKTEKCRRKALFQPFQSNTKTPKYACCDYCDFDFTNWQPTYESKQTTIIQDWQSELAMLFMQNKQ
ncbi:RecQ family ATP-dependent DNA helicase [Paraliobacillus salinarum]|uniref:RecQ family ATP-dependent DNA helicase n=1 Tax=Paraliobacillus salinarum TaxID=1158996 RepID=UPI0015F52F53|nr:ATP-dependent DNA helicase RecQ [Paraliobacillus salinarum]